MIYFLIMRKRILLVMILVSIAGLFYLMAKSYSLVLVNYVVCQSFLQKAPPGFPLQEIRTTFDLALTKSSGPAKTKERYLQDLFRISQRLEKVQRLSDEEAQELLAAIRTHT